MQSLYAGLRGYWPLHEASGTRYSHDGLANAADFNTVSQAAGPVLYAAEFAKATTEYLYVTDIGNLTFNGNVPVTVSCWMRCTEAITAALHACVQKCDSSGLDVDNTFALRFSDATQIQFKCKSNAAVSSVTPVTNTWYFAVGWHDPVADMLYISVDGENPPAEVAHATGLTDASNYMAFGRRGESAQDYHQGQVAEVGIWDRCLTMAEILWLYNKGRGRTWPFDGRPSPALGGRRITSATNRRLSNLP